MFVCLSLKVSASPLQTQQDHLQEKVSNWDGKPQSLAGRAADDAGDCPYMTCDLTFAFFPQPASAYSHHTPANTLLSLTPGFSIAKLIAVSNAFSRHSTQQMYINHLKMAGRRILQVFWPLSLTCIFTGFCYRHQPLFDVYSLRLFRGILQLQIHGCRINLYL